MKDPLRYFLDEGFGSIYVFLNEHGDYEARLRFTKGYEKFAPTIKPSPEKGASILTIGGKDYLTNDDFMRDYGTPVESKQEAEQKIDAETKLWEEVKLEMLKMTGSF